MEFNKSSAHFDYAAQYIPGGVNSPVRAFGSIGITPPFIASARGSRIFDEDGNAYIDYVGSWGPLILGHARQEVIEAVTEAAALGTSFGAPTLREVETARLIVEAVPSVERVRMVNSGTEATMSAIRLARGYSGRDKIVKFEGCYHGHSDALLIKAGSGALTHGVPNSPGVTEGAARDTISARYNDAQQLADLFKEYGDGIAAVIFEPVAGNMGVIPPTCEFLHCLRSLTTQYGALLIADEVMTGFRVAYGGAQNLYGFEADITCFGKIIGGGLPVGAYGGKKAIMDKVSPQGPVYQAGTLSGNPLAMAAGHTTLRILRDHPEIYDGLEEKSAFLAAGIERILKEHGIEARINRVGSMMTLFFTDHDVMDFDSAVSGDTERFKRFFIGLLNQGIYMAPSPYEAAFVSDAHSMEDIKKTIQCVGEVVTSSVQGHVHS